MANSVEMDVHVIGASLTESITALNLIGRDVGHLRTSGITQNSMPSRLPGPMANEVVKAHFHRKLRDYTQDEGSLIASLETSQAGRPVSALNASDSTDTVTNTRRVR